MVSATEPDRVWLAFRRGSVDGVGLFDCARGELVGSFHTPLPAVLCACLAVEDGFVFCGAEDGSIYRWPCAGPDRPVTCSWHADAVRDPRLQLGATATADGGVQIWSLRERAATLQEPYGQGMYQFVFAEDGSVRIGSSGLTGWSGDPDRGVLRPLGWIRDGKNFGQVAARGRWLARADWVSFSLHDAETGERRLRRDSERTAGVAFLEPDLVWIAVNGGPGQLPRFQTWRVDGTGTSWSSELDQEVPVDSKVHDVFWRRAVASRDGSTFATACNDGTVRVYARDGRPVGAPLAHCPGECCFNVALSGDAARLLSTGLDKTVKLWRRTADGTYALDREITRFTKPAQGADFHPDGERVACTSAGGTLRVVRIADLELLEEFEAGAGSTCCQFSPDGSRICATTVDGRFLTWFLDHDELRRRAAAALEVNEVSGGELSPRDRTGSPGR